MISCNLSSNIQHKPESGLRKFDILYLQMFYIRCVNKTLWASLKDDIADTDRHENRQMFLTTVNKTDDQLILQSGDLRPPKKTGRHRKAKRVGQTKNKLNNEYSK
mgnify:CR=1 FL=1